MSSSRTLKDLKGWKLLFTDRVFIGLYGCYASPDEDKLALVHMDDGEITLIWDRTKKEVEYAHPTTLRGAETLGLDIRELFKS